MCAHTIVHIKIENQQVYLLDTFVNYFKNQLEIVDSFQIINKVLSAISVANCFI